MKRTPEKPSKPRASTQKGSSAERAPRGAPRAKAAPLEPGGAQTHPDVIEFLRALDHPMKREIEAVRQIILGVSPEIHEEIKWNAPSFRTTDHFATFNLRTKEHVRLILHRGVKVKDTATKGLEIADPAGLLEWLAKDRCLVTLGDGKDIEAKRAALEAVLRAWIASM
ncbi:uncharacterized protein SOCE26_097540 [Sorangium cellulosum]|uniref:YdhG-like domain-containing protein n=1 Tax=Sorangium cellulosum TaxID=56 RepID=A0A2L0F9L0_SORCE|nr:DUF1801 domain-containing protein [Sorangium cellulosum]AUX48223.1 uncharacterized protein SOCE26_097540 [Sorangium cellulosum]